MSNICLVNILYVIELLNAKVYDIMNKQIEQGHKMTDKEEDYIIKVDNLYKSYGAVKAVDGISFSVKRGELFSFLGLNGAGKTTTINILCSILPKDSGSVLIDGYDIDKNKREIKERLGIVFQSGVLDKKLSVLSNLKSRAALYKLTADERAKRVAEVIELFDLYEILKRKYDRLSGGQKRRVDIARALIHSPKILFLDEPTTGLDPTTRVKVWDVIEGLVKEGLTVFLTTHYMEEVTKADNVIIIDHGRIVAQGTPDELKNKYTTDFLRVIMIQDEKFEEQLQKENKQFSYKSNSYFIEFPSPVEANKFLAKNKKITDFEILKGDMDNVFLNITGKRLEQ